jgi:transcriptional regulator with XRE-family HTH domain
VLVVQRLTNGEAIKAIREPLGIAQFELAERAGISRSHMNKIEKGVEQPAIETAARIARALGVPLAAITYPAPETAEVPT